MVVYGRNLGYKNCGLWFFLSGFRRAIGDGPLLSLWLESLRR